MASRKDSSIDDALAAVDVDTNVFDESERESESKGEVSELYADPLLESARLLESKNNTIQIDTDQVDQMDHIEEENKPHIVALVGIAMGLLFVLLVLSILSRVITAMPARILFLFLLILGLVLVLRITIPPQESFQAKIQVKKFRKETEANRHPKNKQPSWIGKKVSKVKRFLSTEATHAVGGYDDVEFLDVGVGTLVIARNLTKAGEYYSWLGIFGQWRVWPMDPTTRAKLHHWMWQRQQPRQSSS